MSAGGRRVAEAGDDAALVAGRGGETVGRASEASVRAAETGGGGTEAAGLTHGIAPPARDAQLAREGWNRRFIGGPPRLNEMVELYRALGLEVHLEPLQPRDLAEGCGECCLALALFRAVYTRRPT